MYKLINLDNKSDYFTSLKVHQKEAIGLLGIGTFLEYFDLMLYVHMAVILNDLFFPKTDPHTAALVSAFAFCSSYVLRPFGAMIFGYIGDTFGRKMTVVITTLLMAGCCFIMSMIPTYSQIGITAAWIITICRAIQGLASMGEITGAQLYLTETINPPARYPIVSFMAVASVIGTSTALFTASFVTSYNVNWRLAFLFGAIVAVIGTIARNSLRETPDFVDAKKRLKKIVEKSKLDSKLLENNIILQKEKIKLKTIVALFMLQTVWPICSYYLFIYCGTVFKTSFGFTAAKVIKENFHLSMVNLFFVILLSLLSYKISPIKIVKILLIPFYILIILIPLWMNYYYNSFNLLVMRILIIILTPSSFLLVPVALLHIPVFKRFTSISLAFALSHTLGYIISSFSIVYLIEYFNFLGLTLMLLPVTIGFTWAVFHFEKLNQELESIHQKQSLMTLT